jgi:hypothetical protein
MRRLLLVLVFALLALFVLPVAAFAQDEQPQLAWELSADTYVDMTDLGFRFYYPTGWVLDTSKGATIAATQEDIDAQLDGDDSTQSEGMVISVAGLPLTVFADLGDAPTLDDIADFVVEQSQLTEESREEAPVMTRRSISVIGTKNERDGIATLWKQGDNLGIATINVPDSIAIDDIALTWGVTLGSIAPLGAQDLGDGTITDNVSNFTMSYPKDWAADPNQGGKIYELADDVGVDFAVQKGASASLVDAAMTDLGLTDKATLDDVVELAMKGAGLGENATQEEFVFLGQPAITVTGEPSADNPAAGHGVIFTAALVNGRAVIFLAATPTPEAATELLPTWVQMLRSVKPLEAS